MHELNVVLLPNNQLVRTPGNIAPFSDMPSAGAAHPGRYAPIENMS